MSRSVKIASFLLVAGLLSYSGWWMYHYALDTNAPTVALHGVVAGGHYAADVPCTVKAGHPFKVSNISVWLDGTPLIVKYPIKRAQFEHPFSIPTRTLPNGLHTVKVQAVSGTWHGATCEEEYQFNVDNTPLQVAFVKSDNEHKVFQGRTLHVQFQTNKALDTAHIEAVSEVYEAYPESKKSFIYECFVPISCEEKPNEYLFSIDVVDKVGNKAHLENKFQVIAFPFKKQSLTVDQEKMKTEKEIGRPQEELEQELEAALKVSPQEKLWTGIFYAPIDITAVSTEFGVTRMTQEKGRYMHKAVDVLSTPKGTVWATARGKVIVKDRFVFSGNTVVLDHGYGIFSLFYHLDSLANINVGDIINRGAPVGTLGKTGYASGYHLHWEMRINNIQVDPLQWIKPGF